MLHMRYMVRPWKKISLEREMRMVARDCYLTTESHLHDITTNSSAILNIVFICDFRAAKLGNYANLNKKLRV